MHYAQNGYVGLNVSCIALNFAAWYRVCKNHLMLRKKKKKKRERSYRFIEVSH